MKINLELFDDPEAEIYTLYSALREFMEKKMKEETSETVSVMGCFCYGMLELSLIHI